MGKNETKRYLQVNVYLEDSALKELKRVAQSQERSLSAQARLYIDQGLKNESN